MLLVEVMSKYSYLRFYQLKFRGDPVSFQKALDVLEVRIVYEQIAEKISIIAAPFVAYNLGDHSWAVAGRMAYVAAIIFAMEEVIDTAMNIEMARHGVNSLRVRPRLSARLMLLLGSVIGANYGSARFVTASDL